MIESTGDESMLQISSPAGLVFTTAQQDNADGTFTLVACVANVGRQPVDAIDIAFALDASSAIITSLRAPAAPGEVSSRQARAIIGRIPAGFQTQLEVTIRAREGFSEAYYRVMVPKAYRLTNVDPRLRCQAQGSGATLPELVKAEFTVGGESVDARAAAEVLRGANAARPSGIAAMSFAGGAPGLSIPADGLTAVLISTMALILGLGLLTVFARRP